MTDSTSENEGKDLLKSVLHDDGKPVIVSRWGFHIENVGGQKVLVASTKEELAAQLAKSATEMSASAQAQLTDGVPACGGVGPFQCFPYNGCHKCTAVYIGNGYYNCVCVG